MKEKWKFGQFAPIFSPNDFANLPKVVQENV